MSSTISYLNANADWRFVISDVRESDGLPYDLTGYAVAVTFRPDADRSTDIVDCSIENSRIAVTAGAAAQPDASPPVAETGPTITITAPAAGRTWRPTRPTLVVGDVMVSRNGSEDQVKRVAFVALPSTT